MTPTSGIPGFARSKLALLAFLVAGQAGAASTPEPTGSVFVDFWESTAIGYLDQMATKSFPPGSSALLTKRDHALRQAIEKNGAASLGKLDPDKLVPSSRFTPARMPEDQRERILERALERLEFAKRRAKDAAEAPKLLRESYSWHASQLALPLNFGRPSREVQQEAALADLVALDLLGRETEPHSKTSPSYYAYPLKKVVAEREAAFHRLLLKRSNDPAKAGPIERVDLATLRAEPGFTPLSSGAAFDEQISKLAAERAHSYMTSALKSYAKKHPNAPLRTYFAEVDREVRASLERNFQAYIIGMEAYRETMSPERRSEYYRGALSTLVALDLLEGMNRSAIERFADSPFTISGLALDPAGGLDPEPRSKIDLLGKGAN